MATRNLEYEHGYAQGYEYGLYGGCYKDPKREIRLRGLKIRSQFGVGFLAGYNDERKGVKQKYF